jgi:hypothetical protein
MIGVPPMPAHEWTRLNDEAPPGLEWRAKTSVLGLARASM